MPLVSNARGRPIPKGGLKDNRKEGMSFKSPNRVDLPHSGRVGSGSGILGGGDLSSGRGPRHAFSSKAGKSDKGL